MQQSLDFVADELSQPTGYQKMRVPAAAAFQYDSEQAVVDAALAIVNSRMAGSKDGTRLSDPTASKDYVQLRLAGYKHEVFAAIWLDNRHNVIAYEELFTGTIDGCAVYPRMVAQRALENNAAAVIFAHNHPSGEGEPSRADIDITRRLNDALCLFDIRVIDHLIAAPGTKATSMAERNLV